MLHVEEKHFSTFNLTVKKVTLSRLCLVINNRSIDQKEGSGDLWVPVIGNVTHPAF